MPPAHLFTVAQIAAALGRGRTSVACDLKSIPHSGTVVVAGNEARVWAIGSLPDSIQRSLKLFARREGYADVRAFVECCAKAWEPPIPISQCHLFALEDARKLREALRPAVARQELSTSAVEFEQLGIQDYRRQFGYGISAKHWRNLLARTIRRAGPAADYERLDIYLSERPRAKEEVQSPEVPEVLPQKLDSIRSVISGFKDSNRPTTRERDRFWAEVMLAHDEVRLSCGDSKAGRLIRSKLLDIAPWFCANGEALQKTYSRKFEAWKASGGSALAIVDKRRENGAEKFQIPESDINQVIHLAVWHYHGHIAAGWRAAHQRNLLSPATIERFPLGPSKSQVPQAVREAIGPDVELHMLIKRGRRSIDDLTPHVTRSYEGIPSCSVFNADDFTFPVYFYLTTEDGKFELTRGQVLVVICFRSLKIVGWTLIPGRNYSSLHIRSLFARVFSGLAVPKILYLERGIWQSSKLVVGKGSGLSFDECVQGLREFGVSFTHAIRPRSKPVERVGGMLQSLMEGEPGYCGRDERRDCPEDTKRAMEDVKYNRIHPSERFYDFDGWYNRLGEIITTYNGSIQDGRLNGISPNQAFDQFLDINDPPVQYSPKLQYMLAYHKEEREVKPSGIQFQVGKNTYRYYGEELGHLVGRRVLAWFDPENPDSITVTDLNRTNPIRVPRGQSVSAMASLTGGGELLQSGLAQASGQMKPIKARYQVIKGLATLPQRTMLARRSDVETGEQIATIRRTDQAGRRRAESNLRIANELQKYVPPERLASEESGVRLARLEKFMTENK